MTTREDILQSLAARLATDPFFPPADIDEPEPTRWHDVAPSQDGAFTVVHAIVVQDGPPPERMGRARGAEGEALDELELEAAIAYVVQIRPGVDTTTENCRAARRARRDEGTRRIARLIAADRTLGLGPEVYAEVEPAQRDDDVAFPNALPAATTVVPVRTLYPATHAAD